MTANLFTDSSQSNFWNLQANASVLRDMKRVLFVEDHELVHDFFCDLLRQQGYATDCVMTLADARAAIAGGRYDLLVLDVSLPDGSGLDLARAGIADGTPVLMTSGYPEEADMLASHGFRHLQKPFHIERFLSAVRDLAGSP